jgi:hypothetical protein
MMYRVETFPAGTTFRTWLRLTRASPMEASFFTDLLDRFRRAGALGGRSAIGHGQISAEFTPDPGATPPDDLPDWKSALAARRDEAIDALQALT